MLLLLCLVIPACLYSLPSVQTLFDRNIYMYAYIGDVQGLTRGQPLKCYEMTPARMSGAGLLEYDACNPS